MWIRNLVIFLLVNIVLAQSNVENAENTSINKNNTKTTNNKTAITQQEITSSQQNNTVENGNKENTGTGTIVQEEPKFTNIQQELNADDFDFKYYWILLVGSSLAIIGLIVFKSFRMRRSRAEVRYGKPTAQDEIEPLGSNSKWDDESSSENEDEIFDINFLKNTRLQKHSDNV